MKYLEEKIFKIVMVFSLFLTLGPLVLIILVTVIKGGSVLLKTPETIIQSPGPTYLLGGEGGFFHAILGSVYLVVPATIIASLFAVTVSLFLQSDYCNKKFSNIIRILLDVLWGTPSIIFGVFILIILVLTHQRGCLLAGITTLTLLEIPIITRYADEAIQSVPKEIRENAYSMGLTKYETTKIVCKYSISGIIAGMLIGLGRGIGDAATIIFTTGAGSTMPGGLLQSATALPVVIFLQANSFYPSVRNHAYAAAFILILIILVLNIITRCIQNKFSKYITGD